MKENYDKNNEKLKCEKKYYSILAYNISGLRYGMFSCSGTVFLK